MCLCSNLNTWSLDKSSSVSQQEACNIQNFGQLCRKPALIEVMPINLVGVSLYLNCQGRVQLVTPL